ncbi:hypothetical protein Pcinc_026847 [Petrolisthes cinctipes]|uniref:Vezatin n=1 Tax=Petrolisthes cinctipes TaxID=88211 RepID=A0AAE1F5M9_PETCI|nr:hypothetical protein Pcinc_026847 [Petrolisthes cinctipes]
MEEDEDVVFEGSTLHQHLLANGYTDYEVGHLSTHTPYYTHHEDTLTTQHSHWGKRVVDALREKWRSLYAAVSGGGGGGGGWLVCAAVMMMVMVMVMMVMWCSLPCVLLISVPLSVIAVRLYGLFRLLRLLRGVERGVSLLKKHTNAASKCLRLLQELQLIQNGFVLAQGSAHNAHFPPSHDTPHHASLRAALERSLIAVCGVMVDTHTTLHTHTRHYPCSTHLLQPMPQVDDDFTPTERLLFLKKWSAITRIQISTVLTELLLLLHQDSHSQQHHTSLLSPQQHTHLSHQHTHHGSSSPLPSPQHTHHGSSSLPSPQHTHHDSSTLPSPQHTHHGSSSTLPSPQHTHHGSSSLPSPQHTDPHCLHSLSLLSPQHTHLIHTHTQELTKHYQYAKTFWFGDERETEGEGGNRENARGGGGRGGEGKNRRSFEEKKKDVYIAVHSLSLHMQAALFRVNSLEKNFNDEEDEEEENFDNTSYKHSEYSMKNHNENLPPHLEERNTNNLLLPNCLNMKKCPEKNTDTNDRSKRLPPYEFVTELVEAVRRELDLCRGCLEETETRIDRKYSKNKDEDLCKSLKVQTDGSPNDGNESITSGGNARPMLIVCASEEPVIEDEVFEAYIDRREYDDTHQHDDDLWNTDVKKERHMMKQQREQGRRVLKELQPILTHRRKMWETRETNAINRQQQQQTKAVNTKTTVGGDVNNDPQYNTITMMMGEGRDTTITTNTCTPSSSSIDAHTHQMNDINTIASSFSHSLQNCECVREKEGEQDSDEERLEAYRKMRRELEEDERKRRKEEEEDEEGEEEREIFRLPLFGLKREKRGGGRGEKRERRKRGGGKEKRERGGKEKRERRGKEKRERGNRGGRKEKRER